MNKPKVTEKMFKAIKLLLKSGETTVGIAEYMGISDSTVSNIKNSETYEEYRHKVYVSSGAYRKKMAAMKAKEEKEKKAKEVAEEVGAVPASELKKEEQPATQVVEHRQSITLMANHYLMEDYFCCDCNSPTHR